MYDAGAWGGAVHLLCTYHLAKNFFKHVKPVVTDAREWHKLNTWFWKFAKYSDQRFDFGHEWISLMEQFDLVAHGATKGAVRVWLEQLYSRRGQWMAAITWKYTTWGVHSTQRSEAVHSALKSRKLKNLAATVLVDEMTGYNEHSRSKRDVDAVRKSLRHVANLSGVPAFLLPLQSTLTPYAWDLASWRSLAWRSATDPLPPIGLKSSRALSSTTCCSWAQQRLLASHRCARKTAAQCRGNATLTSVSVTFQVTQGILRQLSGLYLPVPRCVRSTVSAHLARALDTARGVLAVCLLSFLAIQNPGGGPPAVTSIARYAHPDYVGSPQRQYQRRRQAIIVARRLYAH
jgi:hypothetical protein